MRLGLVVSVHIQGPVLPKKHAAYLVRPGRWLRNKLPELATVIATRCHFQTSLCVAHAIIFHIEGDRGAEIGICEPVPGARIDGSTDIAAACIGVDIGAHHTVGLYKYISSEI